MGKSNFIYVYLKRTGVSTLHLTVLNGTGRRIKLLRINGGRGGCMGDM
jgi:hypothetical protein